MGPKPGAVTQNAPRFPAAETSRKSDRPHAPAAPRAPLPAAIGARFIIRHAALPGDPSLVTLALAGPLIDRGSRLNAQDVSQKSPLRTALSALASEIAPFTRDPQPLRQAALDATNWVRWLQEATEAWKPASVDDGRPMRVAIERMVLAMRGTPNELREGTSCRQSKTTLRTRSHIVASTAFPARVG